MASLIKSLEHNEETLKGWKNKYMRHQNRRVCIYVRKFNLWRSNKLRQL